MPDQFEQYYKYLKSNGADVAPDFNSFKNTLSDYNNASKYYSYLKDNQFDVPSTYDSFADTFGLKKKDLGGDISSPTGYQSVSKSFISSLPEQKSIYAPSQKLVSESTMVVAPKEAKLISEANKRGDQITKEAIENSNNLYLAKENKGVYKFTKDSPSIQQNKKSLEEDLAGGALQVVKSPKTGKYVLAHNAGIFNSFSNAWDNVLAKQADDKYVAGLSTEDKIKHYEVKDALNQDKYLEEAPSGLPGSFGTVLGENAEPLIKLAAMANVFGKGAQAAGATAQTIANAQKFGSFLAFSTDAGYSGYANNTERVYKSLRQQDPNGNKVEQMKKAENAGLIGEASGIGMAAGMTGIFKNLKGAAETINTKPFVNAIETMAKHTSKEAAVQGSIASLNSIVSDLGAKSQGMDIGVGDVVDNALESGKQMAQFVGVTGLAMSTLTGLMKVPGYVKAQAKGLVSELPREEVKAVYEGAEANGIIPEGTTNKVINSLNEYDVAKQKIPEGLSSEHKAALTGIQEKIDKLENSKKNLAPQYHNRIDGTINSLKERAIKIMDSKNPMSEEVDNILNVKGSEEIAGPPVTEVDLIEQVTPKEVKVTEEVKPTSLEDEYNSKSVDELIALKKKLYPEPDIETPMTPEEKLLDRVIAKKFSEKNQEIIEKRKAAAEKVKPTEVKSVEQLREQEQAELDSKIPNAEQYRVDGKVDRSKLTNEEDIKAFDEVYDKYDKLISPLLEKPKQEARPIEAKPVEEKVTVELLSSKEPPQKEGETIVTLSGKTEAERLASIEQRQKDTKVSDKVVSDNEIVQSAESYFKKSGNYKNSADGRAELNNLRIKARENGLTIDTERNAVTRLNKAGRPRKVLYNNKADGEAVVEPNAKTLRDRDIDTQKVFEELTDSGVFLDVESESGKRMSATQVEAAIKDINEGIPSKRANKYLDALEKAIAEDAFPLYDKGRGGFAPKLADIRTELGIEKEVIGEPMDEIALNKFLDEESKLTPKEEQDLLDNVENLLYEYETTEAGPEGKVQPVKAGAKEGVPSEAKPLEPTKSERQAEYEKIKEYKEAVAKVSKKAKENAKKEFVDRNFDRIVEKLKIQIKCPT